MQFIANKAEDVVGYLENLEEVSELIAAFWSSKADDFGSKAEDMAVNQVELIDQIGEAVADESYKFWSKAQREVTRYISAMTEINNSFNFLTEVKPDKEQSFRMKHLKLTLSVPSFVDLAITD